MTTALQAVFLISFAGILGTVAIGLLSRDLQAVVNGIGSLVASALPTLVEFAIAFRGGAAVTFDPALSAWIAVAAFLHMLGMLGWYDTVSWWDHVTHTVSAALLAALVYATLQTPSALGSQVTDGYAALFTVLFTLGAGVFWEFVELAARELSEYIDRPPVLEYYGLRDTVLDMVFNGIGAIVVVAFDVRIFASVIEEIPRISETVVVASTLLLVVGSFALGFALQIVQNAATDTE
jgi:hypothetical protein